MDQSRFDKIGTYLASGRTSRRKAIQQGAAGLATTGMKTASAQDGTPSAEGNGALSSTPFLFVQSFESGTIAPKDGADGTYTVTLQHGLGHTIYFSDRPERIAGAAPTPRFLDGLGFSEDNPPNAALVIGTDDGGTDIAVVELTNPSYDVGSSTAIYDVTVLENFEGGEGLQFQEASADLAAVAPSFGTAHLFIDDCADQNVTCLHWNGQGYVDADGGRTLEAEGFCYNWLAWRCEPCNTQLIARCNERFPDFCNEHQDCNIRW